MLRFSAYMYMWRGVVLYPHRAPLIFQQASTRNTQHFQAIGDIRKVTEFEQLLGVNRKDLDALRNAFKHGQPPPKFHYESKKFQVRSRCCLAFLRRIISYF